MFRKNMVVLSSVFAIAVGASVLLFFMTDKEEKTSIQPINIKEEVKQEVSKVEPKKIKPKEEVKNLPKKADLYNNISGSQLPLNAIFELSKLPADIQKIIKDSLEFDNSIYMVRNDGQNVFILFENAEDSRHGLGVMEINLTDRSIKKSNIGYQDKDDTMYDVWDYDKNSELKRPVKHKKFDKDGTLEYSECWNYSDKEPVKYEMKDANSKVISIKKETIDNDTDLRLEHLFYDEDGNTKMNISVSYEGPEIKRFTYYNSEAPEESLSVFSEYENGVKIREKVYSSEYKLKNIYAVNYNNDGDKTDITIFDSENNEVDKVISK